METEKQPVVGPLKKVSMSVSAGKRPAGKEIMDANPLEFIFGLGKEGLTPLERNLAGKKAGESVTIQMDRSEIPEFFGHLLTCPQIASSSLASFYMNFKIHGISEASPREVVRAMARTTACGGDCDCGCHG